MKHIPTVTIRNIPQCITGASPELRNDHLKSPCISYVVPSIGVMSGYQRGGPVCRVMTRGCPIRLLVVTSYYQAVNAVTSSSSYSQGRTRKKLDTSRKQIGGDIQATSSYWF